MTFCALFLIIETMDVSVIIVNYNTKALLSDCLRSIYENTIEIEFEVIVSDNGSCDGSQKMIRENFPSVILIENGENLGFGAANNRGLSVARGKYILYLNSDTVLLNNAIKIFFEYWEENGGKENLGALGANLLGREGERIHSSGNFITVKSFLNELVHTLYGVTKLSFFKILHIRKKKREKTPVVDSESAKKEVEYITGADLFLKNDENARFDEDYFMYAEEADLQFKLAKLGKKRLLIENPRIVHLKGGSSDSDDDYVRLQATFSHIYNNISRVIFLKKNTDNKIALFAIKILIVLLWLNPLIFKSTRPYIKKLLAV